MAHMQHRVVELISKVPAARNDTDIKIVLPWLRKKSDLFKDLDKAVLTDVIRNCAYMKAYRDDVIITQGDIGDSFYIMLTGKISVFIDTLKSDEEILPDGSDLDTLNRMSPKETEDSDDDDEDEQEPKKKKPLDRSKYGKFIVHYHEGKSFGEVALMSEDSVRNATVIADEDTDLLVISRELFNRSMKAEQEKEYQERKEFIKRSPYFHNWSLKFKRLLELSIRKEHYQYGSTIVRQGDPVPGLIFIVSGQAKVVMSPTQHVQQYPKLLKRHVDPIAEEFGRDMGNKTAKKKISEFTQHQIRVRRKEGYAAAEKLHMGKAIEISCIEEHDVIGDVEMSLELETCISSVICTANTTVMILDSKNYDRLIAKKHQQTVTKIFQKSLQKINCRLHSANGALIPLLKCLQEKLREKLPKKENNVVLRQQITDQEKQRSQLMDQLVDFFLKGKAPLIEPFVSNALYYRKKSERRAEMKEIQKAKKAQLEQGETKRTVYTRPRRKIARSLKQLKTAKAENELLSSNHYAIRPSSEYALTHSHASMDRRPRTAPGTREQMGSSSGFRRRPQTAMNGDGGSRVFLTEYDANDKDAPTVESDPNLMFNHMDQLQREKSETRSRVICTATARDELISDMKHVNGDDLSVPIPYEDDYFDWETSEGNLIRLEERIKSFCGKIEKKDSRDVAVVSSLRRFHIKDERDENNYDLKVPKPGGTVFVKAKPCDLSYVTQDSDDSHQHIRRYIIKRDNSSPPPSSFHDRPKSAFATRSVTGSESSRITRPKTADPRRLRRES